MFSNEKARQQQLAARKRQWEAIWWAGAFIWAGVVLLIENADGLPEVGGAAAWSWIFVGAGLFSVLLMVLGLMSADEPKPTAWDIVWAGILLIVGLSGFFSVDIALPLILLLIGVVLLARATLGRE